LSREMETLAWLEKKFAPLAAGPDRIAKWFVDLDADEFRVRERAFNSLAKLGESIAPKLTAELDRDHSETKSAYLKKLAELTVVLPPPRGDDLLRSRVEEILSRFDSKEAKELRAKLAGMK
jgi:hypothetical protein